MVKHFLTTATLLILCSCTLLPSPGTGKTPSLQHPAEITQDTTWSGTIVIDGSVKVFKGATMTILPGTEILFVARDDDKDGLGDGTLIIEGSLHAAGTRTQPIRFRSNAVHPKPGDWLEIRVDFSKDTLLRYCEIRDSAHTLHAHFTRAIVEDSYIHHNLDGCRLGQGNFVIRRNLIEKNEGKGINFRNATIEIRDNLIRHNGAGIFLFETDRAPIIEHNNLYANRDNLRLGDFFHTDLNIGENWWGSAAPETVKATIYDQTQDSTLGRVTSGIAAAWLEKTGPRDAARFRQVGSVMTGGFIDAAPVVLGGNLLIAGWDGRLRLHRSDGSQIWSQRIGEVIDAAPISDGTRIYGQSWGCEVFALQTSDGSRLWSFVYPASPSDDHRQGGVLLINDLLLVPAWNGTIYALNPQDGTIRWQFDGNAPLRSTPTVAHDQIYLAGGDGTLWALDLNGRLLWKQVLAAPLLASIVITPNGPLALDRDGRLTAFNHEGHQLWQRALGETCFYAAPIADGEALFVATAGGSLWKLNTSDGSVIWHKTGFGPIYTTPLLIDGRIVIGDNQGDLWAIHAESNNLLDRFHVNGAIQGGPTRFGNQIAFGSRDHALYLLELNNIPESL